MNKNINHSEDHDADERSEIMKRDTRNLLPPEEIEARSKDAIDLVFARFSRLFQLLETVFKFEKQVMTPNAVVINEGEGEGEGGGMN
jgi:hypothetical protein